MVRLTQSVAAGSRHSSALVRSSSGLHPQSVWSGYTEGQWTQHGHSESSVPPGWTNTMLQQITEEEAGDQLQYQLLMNQDQRDQNQRHQDQRDQDQRDQDHIYLNQRVEEGAASMLD
ncbi:hypothetical protein INR49_007116 [Caranx melampygus]|nr:hypothetical protein INR49_007116 [Caranx melampygus]